MSTWAVGEVRIVAKIDAIALKCTKATPPPLLPHQYENKNVTQIMANFPYRK